MAKAKKGKKTARPQGRAEPTTHQLRQEYYRRRADEQALQELGLRDPERPAPKGDATWWADTRDALDRLEIIHAVWRWVGLTASTPEPEDWDPQQGWPSVTEVEQVFGTWDKLLEESGIADSLSVELVEQALEAHRSLARQREEHEVRARRLEEEAARIPEIRRQADVARAKREEADSRAMEAEAARDALARERDALGARVAELERELEAARAAAAAPPQEERPRDEELLEEMERTMAAHARTEAERDDLHALVERLRSERDQDRRTIAELTRLLATFEARGAEELAAAEEARSVEQAPATVLEAVELAAKTARHLRFAPRAFETAAESPFRRPGLVLRTLRQLDELAGRYAAGEMGKSLVQAAAEHGITQYKHDISETTRKRYEEEYTFQLDGRKLWVGPHIGLGSGSGAGFVARIYLHVADGSDPELGRGIIVAVVGRHLPDTTT